MEPCYYLVALQETSWNHLKQAVFVSKISYALEQLGDYGEALSANTFALTLWDMVLMGDPDNRIFKRLAKRKKYLREKLGISDSDSDEFKAVVQKLV